jgi:hypothetical protein
MADKTKWEKYGPNIVDVTAGKIRYVIKADRGSNCWMLDRINVGSKVEPYHQWFPNLQQTYNRLHDMALQDSGKDAEILPLVDEAMRQAVTVGFQPPSARFEG